MTADILNENMEVVGLVDDFVSFIWTERSRECGDFEIETRATLERLDVYKKKHYISLKESDKLMIIDTIESKSSPQEGMMMIVSGKSLEWLLHKRIIWEETVLTGNFQAAIKKLITENAISPTKTNRKLPKLTFKDSTDSRITSITLKEDETQYYGENLYDTIVDLCKQYHVCFRVNYISDTNFQFELYAGTDHTYSQTDNDVVVFSSQFGNLLSSTYIDTDAESKNAALVLGEKRTETYTHNEVSTSKDVQHVVELGDDKSGYDREEMKVDLTSLSMYIKDIKVPEEKYIARLKSKGETQMRATQAENTIDAEVDFHMQFVYGRDYFMGDILEIEDDLGRLLEVRITELVRCQDASGEYVNPSFTPMSEEKDEEGDD